MTLKIDTDKILELIPEDKDTLLLLNDMSLLCKDPVYIGDYVAGLLDRKRTILKNHTRDPELFGGLSCFDRLPAFVPSEIVMRVYSFRFIVSVYMTKSLLFPVEGIKICLYPLIEWSELGVVPVYWYKLLVDHEVLLVTDEDMLDKIFDR